MINKICLNETERMEYTANHFGDDFPLRIEPYIYSMADRLSSDYTGGYWHMYELDNGAFYMAPDYDIPLHVVCMNGYEGKLSADAFGIMVCLYAYSQLSFTDDEEFADTCIEQYYLLREFMFEQPEVQAILAAID